MSLRLARQGAKGNLLSYMHLLDMPLRAMQPLLSHLPEVLDVCVRSQRDCGRLWRWGMCQPAVAW